MFEEVTICAANAYDMKYYLDPSFESLPTPVKQELKAKAVLFTAEHGGIFHLMIDGDEQVQVRLEHNADDFSYDAIGAQLKAKEWLQENEELLSGLVMYRRIFTQESM